MEETKLVPDYSGIRPKLRGPGMPRDQGKAKDGAADFNIQGAESHGVVGLVNLMGIESPGLTASLAIGEHVADILQRELA